MISIILLTIATVTYFAVSKNPVQRCRDAYAELRTDHQKESILEHMMHG